MRWRITLEYVGTAFEGWQLQASHRTVQGVVEAAATAMVGHPVRISVSGRTDAGVHARAQVASFVSDIERTPEAMRDGLNFHLPNDVACVQAEIVVDAFNPRRWSWGKHYRYTWLDRPGRSPLRDDRAWHVRTKLDEAAMAESVLGLLGEHDFTSFRARGCAAKHPIRKIDAISVIRRDDEVHLDIKGQGFLRHMVRIIAGTVTEVGLRRQPASWVTEVLTCKNRGQAGRTAPARGLCLMSVQYEEGPPPWITDGDETSDVSD